MQTDSNTNAGAAGSNVPSSIASSGGLQMKSNLSSLPLEIFLQLLIAIQFYYPSKFLGWELTTIFLYLLIECVRLVMLSKGNKTGILMSYVQAMILTIPIIILHVYYISLQTYVLRVDLVLNSVAFIMLGIQTFLGFFGLLNVFFSSRKF